jgi:hypothetical protein
MLPYQFLAEMRLYIVMTLHLVLLLDRMHEVRAYLVVGPHAFRRGSAFQPFFSLTFDKACRHAVHRVNVVQPRVTKQGKAGDAKHRMEHVHHITRAIRNATAIRILKGCVDRS